MHALLYYHYRNYVNIVGMSVLCRFYVVLHSSAHWLNLLTLFGYNIKKIISIFINVAHLSAKRVNIVVT